MSEIEDSEYYSPEGDHCSEEGEPGQVYKRRVEKLNKNSIEGKWTEEENLKYVLYMDYHYKIFSSKEKRKSERIFKSLSEYLTTRTPRQCRSHFQKIMNKFKKVKKVKQHYQEELGLEKYEAHYEALTADLKNKSIKIEETEVPKCLKMVNEEIQTDPLKVGLGDLSNIELIKLMNLLNEYQKVTIAPFNWMGCSQIGRVNSGL